MASFSGTEKQFANQYHTSPMVVRVRKIMLEIPVLSL